MDRHMLHAIAAIIADPTLTDLKPTTSVNILNILQAILPERHFYLTHFRPMFHLCRNHVVGFY